MARLSGYTPYPVTNSMRCPDMSAGVGREGSNSELLRRQRKAEVTSLLMPEYGIGNMISWWWKIDYFTLIFF